MIKHILVDSDGVLTDWNKSFNEYMHLNGMPMAEGTESAYNLATRYNLPMDDINTIVTNFNKSDAIRTLSAFSDAAGGVEILAKLGFKFTVITSLGNDPTAKKRRVENLTMLFGDVFSDIICLPLLSSKRQALSAWANSGLFWIEDHFLNAEVGHEVGLSSIIIDTPYNRHYQTDLFPRVNEHAPWKEIVKIVRQKYQV